MKTATSLPFFDKTVCVCLKTVQSHKTKHLSAGRAQERAARAKISGTPCVEHTQEHGSHTGKLWNRLLEDACQKQIEFDGTQKTTLQPPSCDSEIRDECTGDGEDTRTQSLEQYLSTFSVVRFVSCSMVFHCISSFGETLRKRTSLVIVCCSSSWMDGSDFVCGPKCHAQYLYSLFGIGRRTH